MASKIKKNLESNGWFEDLCDRRVGKLPGNHGMASSSSNWISWFSNGIQMLLLLMNTYDGLSILLFTDTWERQQQLWPSLWVIWVNTSKGVFRILVCECFFALFLSCILILQNELTSQLYIYFNKQILVLLYFIVWKTWFGSSPRHEF